MCAVCSECSLNLVAGQVFVGACSVGFFNDLYYQGTNVAGYIVFALYNYVPLPLSCGSPESIRVLKVQCRFNSPLWSSKSNQCSILVIYLRA